MRFQELNLNRMYNQSPGEECPTSGTVDPDEQNSTLNVMDGPMKTGCTILNDSIEFGAGQRLTFDNIQSGLNTYLPSVPGSRQLPSYSRDLLLYTSEKPSARRPQMQFSGGVGSLPSAVTTGKQRSRVQMARLQGTDTVTPSNPLSEATPHPNESGILVEGRASGEESPEHGAASRGRSLRVTAMRDHGPPVDFSHTQSQLGYQGLNRTQHVSSTTIASPDSKSTTRKMVERILLKKVVQTQR